MAKSGLRKVMKSVRGKHGTVRRAYYMKSGSAAPKGRSLRSAAPGGEASRTRRAIGTIVGGMVGAGVGALFGAGAGAAAGGIHAKSTLHRSAMWHAGINTEHGNVHPSVARAVTANFVKNNPASASAHMTRGIAGSAAIFGTGGAVAGGAFGAALGYAAASRLGRGGRAGRGQSLASQGPSRNWSERFTGEYRPTPIQPHERPDAIHNSPSEYNRRHTDNQKRSRP